MIESIIESKYPTSLQYDLKVLEALNGNEPSEDETIRELIDGRRAHHWRLKLAVIHRVNQKEILHQQLKFCKMLLTIMNKC